MTRQCLLTLTCFLSLFVAQAQDKSGAEQDSTAPKTDSAAFAATKVELASSLAADTTATSGAPQQKVEMADVMRSEGKIYVVVGIVLIVLVLMLLYLFTIDRNVKRLEKLLAEKGK